jgi:hypothetical protein
LIRRHSVSSACVTANNHCCVFDCCLIDTLFALLQVAIPATLGLLAFDRIALRGAVVESSARLLVPNYKEKIVRHEAGELYIKIQLHRKYIVTL